MGKIKVCVRKLDKSMIKRKYDQSMIKKKA